MSMKQTVALNDNGRPIGEGHHRAKVPDQMVDLFRELHEDYGVPYLTLEAMGKHYGLSKSWVHRVCNYEIRADTPMDWKVVHLKDAKVARDESRFQPPFIEVVPPAKGRRRSEPQTSPDQLVLVGFETDTERGNQA